jgi:hypothetical protein
MPIRWERGGAVGWGTALQDGKSRVWFTMKSLEFFMHLILSVALDPWFDSAFNKNLVTEISPAG